MVEGEGEINDQEYTVDNFKIEKMKILPEYRYTESCREV
jgi:hypothetical protein